MNRAEFLQAGGFPLTTNTLDFIQGSFTLLEELAALAGDRVIVSGCVKTGTQVSDGTVILNGELLPLRGGTESATLVLIEEVTNREFEDGVSRAVYYDRYVRFGSGANSVPWADFVRLKELKNFRNTPHEFTSSLTEDTETKLATAKAVKELNDKITAVQLVPSGAILMWSGSVASIPEGYLLCNGANGTPNLLDRFIVGAGTTYIPGQTGGANSVELSLGEIPLHRHYVLANASVSTADTLSGGNQVARTRTNGGQSNANLGGVATDASLGRTSSAGSSQAHENRPPFYALAYIMKS